MPKEFMIGELARHTGCNVPTIRYYEEIGIMPLATRAANNRRIYNQEDIKRLSFICHCRELGFSPDKIRLLLALADNPSLPCSEVDQIARNHLKEVEQKITSLSIFKSELTRMINHCEGETISECRIIEVLANHNIPIR